MRITILAAGTRGDVQPVLALGAELRRRGHAVTLAVNSDLADWAGRAGIDVVPTGLDVGRFLGSEEARRFLATGRVATTLRRIAADERRCNDDIVAACVEAADGADLVLTTMMMSHRGLCLEDATGVPVLPVFYFPFQATRRWAGIASGVRDLRLAPANRATAVMFHAALWQQNRANVDDMCAALGIPPYRHRPRLEDRPSLHLYSAALAPAPDDWAARHEVVGWTTLRPELRRTLGEPSASGELRSWLDDGPPPVYFGFGSMPVLDPESLVRSVAEVTARRGLRGLVGAGWTDYERLRGRLPAHLFLASGGLDHDEVLPRCRSAVHHGGSGTTAAVRAGLPSVVASVFADQPFWGWRVARAGAGVTLPFRRLTPGRLATALDRVLTDDCVAAARRLAGELRDEDGTKGAAEVVVRRDDEARQARPAPSGRRSP